MVWFDSRGRKPRCRYGQARSNCFRRVVIVLHHTVYFVRLPAFDDTDNSSIHNDQPTRISCCAYAKALIIVAGRFGRIIARPSVALSAYALCGRVGVVPIPNLGRCRIIDDERDRVRSRIFYLVGTAFHFVVGVRSNQLGARWSIFDIGHPVLVAIQRGIAEFGINN